MKRVLSVQSHVVHGYVGGRAATFPLQHLGWDVDNINTVNFSNHTGYGSVQGLAITVQDMENLFRGLHSIECSYEAIILGYVPSAELLDVISANVSKLKIENPDLVYICDPVMGDQGYLYVDRDCVEAYRRLLKNTSVNILTPNQFELELLCGFSIDSAESLKDALRIVHDEFGIQNIIVTSLSGSLPLTGISDEKSLSCVVSTHGAPVKVFLIPVIESYFTGVGDLFTALLLEKFYEENLSNLVRAVNQVLTVMADVLTLTHEEGLRQWCKHKGISLQDANLVSKMNDRDTMRFFELRIVQARHLYGYADNGKFKAHSLK